jgi:hypothetical protein
VAHGGGQVSPGARSRLSQAGGAARPLIEFPWEEFFMMEGMMKRFLIAAICACAMLAGPAMAQNTSAPTTSDKISIVRVDANGVGTSGAVTIPTVFNTAGVGYSAGGGGAVTQITGRTTGVTLNANSGAITLVSAAGSTTPASFTVTNSKVAATDVIVLNQKSGTDLYSLSVTAVAAGSFQVTFNTKSGTTTEQPVINFAVLKGAAS